MRRPLSLATSFLPVLVFLAASSSAQQILTINNPTFLAVKPSSPTAVQSIRPQVSQRGVNFDGSLRSAPGLRMAVQGNPFEDAWVGRERQGSVRLDTGTFDRQEIDIALPCKGRVGWVVGRTFNARQTDSGGSYRNSDGYQGANWMQSSQPEILLYVDGSNHANDVVYLVYGADRFIECPRVSSTSNQYLAANGAAGVFDYQSGTPDLWVYNDQVGTKFTFIGFNTSGHAQDGILWKIEDEDGNVSFVGDSGSASTALASNVGWDSAGRILYAFDAVGRRYSYAYTTLNSVVRLTQVKAETKTGGTWASPTGVAEVARVDYDYYGNAESYGTSGDLKKATVTMPLTDSGKTSTQKHYYRYWTASWSGGAPGHPHALKYVYDPEGVRRFDWLDSNLDDDHLSASEDDLASYAAAYFEYDQTLHRLTKAYFNGECGCSGSGANGEYQYSYETMEYSASAAYDNASSTRTIVKRPDATYLTQEFDEAGQAMDRIESDLAPSSGGKQIWVWAVTRSATGMVTDVNTPENVSGYVHDDGSTPPLHVGTKTKEASAGKISTSPRTSSGDLKGFRTDLKYQKGTGGTSYFDETRTWTTRSKTIGDTAVVRPLVASRRSYTINDSTGTSGSNLVSYTYASYSGTLQPEGITIDYPLVSSGNNGSNAATHRYQHLRKDGLVDYEEDEEGHVTYREYTNGQETLRIEDAYTDSSEFSGLTIPTVPVNFDTAVAAALRRKTVTTYDAQGRVSLVTSSFGSSAAYSSVPRYYSRLGDQRLVVLEYADYDSGTPTYYGPVRYSVTNQAGKSEVSGLIGLSSNASTAAQTTHIDEDDPDPITAVDTGSSFGSVARMSTSIYSHSGTELDESRSYFLIPGSGAGSAGTNYDATTYGYDDAGRRWRVKDASGTIRRTVFDAIGRRTQSWIGTNDHSFVGGEAASGDNMVKTEAVEYDGNADKGNSFVTKVTRYVEGTTSGQRVTTYVPDLRGRRIVEIPPTAPYTVTKYDNLGRVVATGQYSSSSGLGATSDPTSLATNRMALSESVYDEMGRVWKRIRHKIDDADGSDDDTLESLSWYDAAGRLIKSDGEQLRKTAYDRLGRATDEYLLAKDNDSTYANAADVAGDIVLEQSETRYDTASPVVLMSVSIQRKQNDFGGSETTGALDTNDDASAHDPLKLTFADVKGRAQITAHWYDQFERQTDTVQYGTYSGGDFTRSGLSVPSRSDLALRTSTAYNTDGTVDTVTDPRALVSKYVYDALGRRTKEIKNYSSGVNSGNPYGTDQNVTVGYGYTNGLRTSLTAVMENPVNNQVTTYTFGTTKGTSAGDSKIATGNLIQKVTYPDSGGSTDVVTFAYNAQGQEMWKRDQAGTIIETDFDLSGRATQKRATATGSGIDTAILRIATSYDSLGRTSEVDQYNDATVGNGTVQDGAALSYDDWGNVASFAEDRDSAVTGGGNQYVTSYSWEKATTGRNTLRKTGMTMPDSRAITYPYGSSGGLHDDDASRVTTVVDGGSVTLAEYSYLGAAMVVRTNLNEIACMSRVTNDSGDVVDLDVFNRITTSRWTKDLSTDRDFYQVALAYDRDSNITSALDGVHGAYHGITAGYDVAYSMDNVNRLTEAQEGTLSGGSITSQTRDELWTLSQTGNWDRAKLNLNGDADFTDAGELDDTRTHNAVNELTARNTDSSGGNEYSLTYDAAGNMTDDAKDYKYVYDAWNRLRMVKKTSDSALVAEYRYNGLDHRIGVHEDTDLDGDVDASDKWYYDVFDERWRQLARYRESDTSPKEDFVPHQAGASGKGGSSYIDLVICRNKDKNTAWTTASDGTLEERLYLCQNWRADVSAIISSSGMMMGWVKYSAYGTPIGLPGGDTDSDGDCQINERNQVQTWIDNSQYDVRGDIDLDGDLDATDKSTIRNSYEGVTLGRGVLSASSIANRKGYAGYEALGGLAGSKWLARSRVLAADLGRWTRRDPRGYDDGMSHYQYVRDAPVQGFDPFGLMTMSRCAKGAICAGDEPGSAGGNSEPEPRPSKSLGQPLGTSDADLCCLRAGPPPLGAGSAGWSVCCNGRRVSCIRYSDCGDHSLTPTAGRIIRECIAEHENQHAANGDLEPCPPTGVSPALWNSSYSHQNKRDAEGGASGKEADCLKEHKSECDAEGAQADACRGQLRDRDGEIDTYVNKTVPGLYP